MFCSSILQETYIIHRIMLLSEYLAIGLPKVRETDALTMSLGKFAP
jgi:hypothetical protein